MERSHKGSAEPPSLSTCPRQLAQQARQTGPIVKAQQRPGGACLRISDTAIDPLQCSDPGPFSPPTHNDPHAVIHIMHMLN